MADWLTELAGLERDAGEAVLVTVAGVRGSAPREVGAKMLVTAGDSRGTIGGGALEYRCLGIAAGLLRERARDGLLRRFPLGSDCGQCCGGVVDVLFEPVAGLACRRELLDAWHSRRDAVLVTTLDDAGRPRKTLYCDDGDAAALDALPPAARDALRALSDGREAARRVDTPGRSGPFLLLESLCDGGFDVAVFGAGHVGSALVRLLAGLDCRLRWIDSRRGLFPEALPAAVRAIEAAEPAREVAALPAGACYFVMTHSHALDLDITAAILRRDDFAYLGLIGSVTKRRRFESRLRQQGIAAATLARLTCPIGIAGIGGKTPQEIAIAAAAELLSRRDALAATGSATRSRRAGLRPVR